MRIAPGSGVRLVLDTNTALSGLLWDGAPARLIEAAEAGADRSRDQRRPANRIANVLSREKFSRPLARRNLDRHGVFAHYLALMSVVAPALISPAIIGDPADDAVLAAATGGKVDLIVSGDAHLLNVKSFLGIEIVTAAIVAGRIDTPG